MDQRLKFNTQNYKTLRRKHRKASQYKIWQWFHGYDTKVTGNKRKKRDKLNYKKFFKFVH